MKVRAGNSPSFDADRSQNNALTACNRIYRHDTYPQDSRGSLTIREDPPN